MTQNGDPYENAVAERVNGILKTELLQKQYNNEHKARKAIHKAITIYNTQRPHLSIGLLTPEQAHTQQRTFKKLWKNYNQEKSVQKPVYV